MRYCSVKYILNESIENGDIAVLYVGINVPPKVQMESRAVRIEMKIEEN